MARITVEDCLLKIPNRFQLVLAATYRARMLTQGHAPKIESKNKDHSVRTKKGFYAVKKAILKEEYLYITLLSSAKCPD